MNIPLNEQSAEVRREIALRKACYPAWTQRGKLDPGEAKYQLAVMQAVLQTLTRLDLEQRQLPLFREG